MKTKLTTSVSRLGVFVIVSIALIFALAPLVWMINISFSQPEDAIKLPPVLFKDPTLQNYRDVLLGMVTALPVESPAQKISQSCCSTARSSA